MISSPSDLLAPSSILCDLHAANEEAAIHAVTAMLASNPAVLDARRLAGEVIERERLSSTALGCGVAFPHARTTAVREIVIAAGRSIEGVPFGGGRDLVHFIFIIGTPPDRAAMYLALVGKLARLLSNGPFRQRLLAAETPDAFLGELRSGV